MEDIGSLVFYVLLGVIAIVGSLQGKNKKKGTAPRNVFQNKPATTTARPPASFAKPAEQRPQYMSADPSVEDRYKSPPADTYNNEGSFRKLLAEVFSDEGSISNPMAEAYSDEGSISNPMAEAFSNEGSKRNPMADAFSKEGSMSGNMAAAFAAEGSSVFFDASLQEFLHNEIADSEIGDIAEYDYNTMPGSDKTLEDFNLWKAVVYSAVLNRKEYTY